AAEVQPRDSHAIARLPIDRVFTMKGFGTVVTGTLVAGTIRREDELEVLPTGRRVRVRGVQVHGETSEAATAGQRTALNLAGTSTEDLTRGMTLVPPATFEKTRRADVLLRLLASATRPLKDRSRVHLHAYTMETVAEIVLFEGKEQNPAKDATKEHAQVLPRGICADQVAGGRAPSARRSVHSAAIFAGGDYWRRDCFRRGACFADAEAWGLPENLIQRRCQSDSKS
ncbi:MAG: EF-Tu/IF-2/RF-3 family GTPase, partial [Candidatus Sulfotelmatobacter sp.]